MVDVLNLYADDSGSRKLDRKEDGHRDRNWFGLGGILVKETDEEPNRQRYQAFVDDWPEMAGFPLHSVDIRNRSANFSWLRKDTDRANRFYEAITELICGSSIVCIAAVIDRPGYRARYESRYRERWLLCKTAFTILVERAAKHAASIDHRLRVMVERGDKKTDARMRAYYDALRENGMPFDGAAMARYSPLDGADFAALLYEFRTKNKSSPMMQLADLCLYPLCLAPYNTAYSPYRTLVEHGKLIDALLDPADVTTRGVKYSCFEPRMSEHQRA